MEINIIQIIINCAVYLCLAFLAGVIIWGIILTVYVKLNMKETEWKDDPK